MDTLDIDTWESNITVMAQKERPPAQSRGAAGRRTIQAW
jgi:hypothetical protein